MELIREKNASKDITTTAMVVIIIAGVIEAVNVLVYSNGSIGISSNYGERNGTARNVRNDSNGNSGCGNNSNHK